MIKRRLKYTASFFALWFPVYGSVIVCTSAMASGSVGYGSALLAMVRLWSVMLALCRIRRK